LRSVDRIAQHTTYRPTRNQWSKSSSRPTM